MEAELILKREFPIAAFLSSYCLAAPLESLHFSLISRWGIYDNNRADTTLQSPKTAPFW